MKITIKKILDNFSFIDYEVTDVLIYPNTKSIIFYLSGASYLENNVRKELNKGYLKIEHFESIKISSYAAVKKEIKEVEIGNQEKMIQLCEIDYIKNTLIFKGYAANSYHWLEFKIQGGIFDGNFTELN